MNERTLSEQTAAAVEFVEGDLVASRLPALRARLREMIAAGTLRLTLDLASVRMVDSSGIGLLVATHNSLKKVGGELALIHASPDIFSLFRSMRIHQHFRVSGS